jgi:tetratricopeptide (TPR) repeat protein
VEVTTNQGSVAIQPAKRTFVQRINPVNLFKRNPKPEPRPTPLPPAAKPASIPTKTESVAQSSPPATLPPKTEGSAVKPATRPIPRYAYRAPAKPAAGNRQEAERAFTQGARAYGAGSLAEAILAYQTATQADPAYFDAHYNLGLAAAQAGRLPQSLIAYETALAIEPESVNARYNFALGLKQAGCLLDAANELERILSGHATETRAHLALANLYAEQLRQPARARTHYNRVLVLEPRHPQAYEIRRWLVQNPG